MKKRFKTKGLTFIELILVISLMVIFSGLGLTSYLTFHQSALTSADIRGVKSMLHQARFSAVKPSDGSDFGLYLNTEEQKVELFQGTYEASNVVQERQLLKLTIGEINLQPNPGVTNQVLFQKITGKTVNEGSFTLESSDLTYTFSINAQGTID